MRSTICGMTITETQPKARHVAAATHGGACGRKQPSQGRRERTAPDDGQDRQPPAGVNHEERERRVGARDQHVDGRVVEERDPPHALRRPPAAMKEAAAAEHERDARSEDGRADLRDAGAGVKNEQDSDRHRDEKRADVGHPPEARRDSLRRARGSTVERARTQR